MKGFFALCVVALAVVCVFAQEYEQVEAEVAHHRAKRSPYDPTLPLILGKSFLLGSLLGPKIFSKGWGWGHRHHFHSHHGHGWAPASHGWSSGWSSPVVVTHHHGWGGWH